MEGSTETFPEVVERLRSALGGPLPGLTAQLHMAPRPRPGWDPGQVPDDARDAAGLVLLYPIGGAPHLVLTVRRDDLPSHAGQVSLPGGEREAEESIVEAAVREAKEEIGVEGVGLEILGALTPLHIPVSGYVLHPVVAARDSRPGLKPADAEVGRVLEVPVSRLADRTCTRKEIRERGGTEYEVPYFAIDGEKVWGATAMILAELLWLLGRAPDPWDQGKG